jgi:hypothetical protein
MDAVVRSRHYTYSRHRVTLLRSVRQGAQRRSGDERMEILAWLWWGIAKILGLVWSFVWFLLGGWVATLVQLLIIVGIVFALRYGWRRAPSEMLTRGRNVTRFVWAWLRMREPGLARSAQPALSTQREIVREIRIKDFGDVSASTLLTVLMLMGMLAAGAL